MTISHSAIVTLAARRVDAHIRARETLQRRRDVNLLERREVSETLDTTELFKLSKGGYTFFSKIGIYPLI